jgi:hypothetical protein
VLDAQPTISAPSYLNPIGIEEVLCRS